jgi:hypothetical protein
MAILNPKTRGATQGRLAARFFFPPPFGMVFRRRIAQPGFFAGRAGAEFHRAQTQFQSHTNEPAAAWQFARACYDFADFATNDTERAALAEQGIAACHQLLAREPKSAPGHYYLGMNFGQLARMPRLRPWPPTSSSTKSNANSSRRRNWTNISICRSGAQCLGELYFQAPGWPLSVGSKHKAREWLERAVKLAPDYPENHLNLMEARLKWNDRPARNAN